MADKALRVAKSEAHRAFDPLWKSKQLGNRSQAYNWLANQLNIPKQDCHIGMMDVDTCAQVIEVCRKRIVG